MCSSCDVREHVHVHGLQGGPMAANLIKAGLPVLVFDRNPAAVQKLTRLGAKEAGSPQEIGSTPGRRCGLSSWVVSRTKHESSKRVLVRTEC